MNNIYAMQRANGDWFALEDGANFRVPVFSSTQAAMQARAFNVEMLVFKPVRLDEPALKDLASGNGQRASYFWLVRDGSTNMKRGEALKHEQLTLLINNVDEASLSGTERQ